MIKISNPSKKEYDLSVKTVSFMGDELLAAKDKDGNIWAGVSSFCRGIGFSKSQRDSQVQNIQNDEVLKGGCLKFQAGVFDPNNETLALQLDYIPLWLAKISITPSMKENSPELVEKLVKYQLKVKDVLAAAFIQKQGRADDVQGLIRLLAQGETELYEKVEGLEGRFNKLESDMPVFNADAKDIQNALRGKAIEVLGGKHSNAYKDKSVRGYVFADIQVELRRQFGVKRYDQIKHKDVPIALKIIGEYKPPSHIKNKIDMANAQQTFGCGSGG